MNKTISYKGAIAIGQQDRIRLKTIKGKVGYKITKFSTLSSAPGTTDHELVTKIFKTDQSAAVSPAVDFTDSDLLAVSYYKEGDSNGNVMAYESIIFDNEVFNQDIFITMDDATSATTPGNYYLELETMDLSDIETTKLTLQSIRTVTSR